MVFPKGIDSSEPHPNFFEARKCVVIDVACALYTSYNAELIDALSGIVNKTASVNSLWRGNSAMRWYSAPGTKGYQIR